MEDCFRERKGGSINLCCCACITSSEAGIIEFCSKFDRTAPPGCVCIKYPFESLSYTLSLRIQMMEIQCDTKTLDNVFCTVSVAVMYHVIREKCVDACYKLNDPRPQIRSYVLDVIRSTLPRMELDQAFASKDTIADSCEEQLTQLMGVYGYKIEAVLITDLEPDRIVKASMNDINASQRLRLAAAEKAEGEKILQVKAAEADADSKYLSGQGVARQRKAVVDGLRETVSTFSGDVKGAKASDVLDLLLVTQYFDMMKDISNKSQSKALFLKHNPTAVGDLRNEMKTGLLPMNNK